MKKKTLRQKEQIPRLKDDLFTPFQSIDSYPHKEK